MSNRVVAEQYQGFSALTISSMTVAVYPLTAFLTGGIQPSLAQLTFEGSSVRVSMSRGFTATSGSGHLFASGSTLTLRGSDTLSAMNLIATSPTGTIMVSVGYL